MEATSNAAFTHSGEDKWLKASFNSDIKPILSNINAQTYHRRLTSPTDPIILRANENLPDDQFHF